MITPLILSIRVAVSATALALVLGLIIARILARRRHVLARGLDALATLPLVLPPTVLGYYLLVLLGQRSPLGRWLSAHGMPLVFTLRGAIIAATVVALPLIVQSARVALESVPQELEDVARTLGRSERAVFFTVTLPLAWRGILSGVILALARTLGEFGATLMVAGNIPGRTQTLAIAIYDATQAGRQAQANAMVALLTVVAVLLLIALRSLPSDGRGRP